MELVVRIMISSGSPPSGGVPTQWSDVMKQLEAKLEETIGESNPFSIQLDGPMQKNAETGVLELKPMGFPQDARWYYSGG
jgi:hypothetical protein